MARHDDSTESSWDAVADDWTRHADTNDYRNFLLMPLMLELAGDVRGLRVLDLGCGEGGYSRALAERGATVRGIDSSPRLIGIARQRSSGIEFVCTNANALEAIDSASVDLVIAPMVLMDVEDYEGAIAEAVRVLRPGGHLVMSILHPCFTAPAAYFDRMAWDDFMTSEFAHAVVHHHRPLQDYMRAAIDCGLTLESFHEPDGSEAAQQSPRFEKLKRTPYFVFLAWRKPGR